MTRTQIILLCLFVLSLPLHAQNKPVPEYLVKQEFPDSVKNLAVVNSDGKVLPFSDVLKRYQGKKIVVDIWASWCRDCIVGLPKLNELKRKTGEEKIVYLFLSIDKDETKWHSAISRFDIRGEHYRVETGAWNNTLANYIVLDWVPRYLILDEAGTIIMPKAIQADELEKSFVE